MLVENGANATGVQIFSNLQFGEVRVAKDKNNQPLFAAVDIARSLGYENPAKAIATHCKPGNITFCYVPHTNGVGGVNVQFINESNVYRLVMRSKLPDAEKFQDWVVEEVLPSIRRDGGYIAASPEETPEQIMARALIIAQKTIESHKQKVQMLEGEVGTLQAERKILVPRAEYTNEVLQSTSTFTLTQVAHDLGFRSVYAFTAWCKEKGILFYQSEQWQPTAKYADKGFFTTRTARYIKNDNTIGTSLSTVVTEKGRMYLHNLRKLA